MECSNFALLLTRSSTGHAPSAATAAAPASRSAPFGRHVLSRSWCCGGRSRGHPMVPPRRRAGECWCHLRFEAIGCVMGARRSAWLTSRLHARRVVKRLPSKSRRSDAGDCFRSFTEPLNPTSGPPPDVAQLLQRSRRGSISAGALVMRPAQPRQQRMHIAELYRWPAPNADASGRVPVRRNITRHTLIVQQVYKRLGRSATTNYDANGGAKGTRFRQLCFHPPPTPSPLLPIQRSRAIAVKHTVGICFCGRRLDSRL